jgi:hypothetical protein
MDAHKINLSSCFFTYCELKTQRKGWCAMTEKDGFSKPEKVDILKRVIKKYYTSSLSREEKKDILKRLVRKYSASRLSKQETIRLLKQLMLTILGRRDTFEDPVEILDDLRSESANKD